MVRDYFIEKVKDDKEERREGVCRYIRRKNIEGGSSKYKGFEV